MSRDNLGDGKAFYKNKKRALGKKVKEALADQETLNVFLEQDPEACCRKFIFLLTVSIRDFQTSYLKQDESLPQAQGSYERMTAFDYLLEKEDQILSTLLCDMSDEEDTTKELKNQMQYLIDLLKYKLSNADHLHAGKVARHDSREEKRFAQEKSPSSAQLSFSPEHSQGPSDSVHDAKKEEAKRQIKILIEGLKVLDEVDISKDKALPHEFLEDLKPVDVPVEESKRKREYSGSGSSSVRATRHARLGSSRDESESPAILTQSQASC